MDWVILGDNVQVSIKLSENSSIPIYVGLLTNFVWRSCTKWWKML